LKKLDLYKSNLFKILGQIASKTNDQGISKLSIALNPRKNIAIVKEIGRKINVK